MELLALDDPLAGLEGRESLELISDLNTSGERCTAV